MQTRRVTRASLRKLSEQKAAASESEEHAVTATGATAVSRTTGTEEDFDQYARMDSLTTRYGWPVDVSLNTSECPDKFDQQWKFLSLMRVPKKTDENDDCDEERDVENDEEIGDIEELASCAYPAPVDTLGCSKQASGSDPKIRRFHVLVGLLLSSQTKDATTAAAVASLKTECHRRCLALLSSTRCVCVCVCVCVVLLLLLTGGLGSLSVDAVLQMTESEIDACICKVGFHQRKANYLLRTARKLRDEFHGDIPDNVKDLCSLPGVGSSFLFHYLSRTLSLSGSIIRIRPENGFLGNEIGLETQRWHRRWCFLPSVVRGECRYLVLLADVHVHRIANRLHWTRHGPGHSASLYLSRSLSVVVSFCLPSRCAATKTTEKRSGTKNPEDTRRVLESWLPRRLWPHVNLLLVGLGQTVCKPRKPQCNKCLLGRRGLCPTGALCLCSVSLYHLGVLAFTT
ncbi:MAG: hypothetical protein MHM6MM_005466 [Cercozoa sp. M6MM]